MKANRLDDVDHPRGIGPSACQVQGQREVLFSGQSGYQVVRLENEPNLVPSQKGEVALGETAEFHVADVDRARRQVVEACRAVHEGGLAGARRSHDGGKSALLEFDVYTVQGANFGVPGSIDL